MKPLKTNQNHPKRAKTTQNEPKQAKTTQNEPKRVKTTQNELKSPKTSQKEPKPPKTSQNHPKRAKTTQNEPKLPKERSYNEQKPPIFQHLIIDRTLLLESARFIRMSHLCPDHLFDIKGTAKVQGYKLYLKGQKSTPKTKFIFQTLGRE